MIYHNLSLNPLFYNTSRKDKDRERERERERKRENMREREKLYYIGI